MSDEQRAIHRRATTRTCLVFVSALSLISCSDVRPAARSVVLVTIDTLRADAIGAYGALPSPTPHLDAFAASALVFERAAAPMPITRPTHASIMTGRYPREHGVVSNARSLAPDRTTLAGVLAEHGFATAAFVSVSLLARESGITGQFGHVDAPSAHQRSGGHAVRAALAWIDALEGEAPFFLWVHVFEPHMPYEPPPDHRAQLDPELAEALPRLTLASLEVLAQRHDGDLPQRLLDHARALYRGDVAAADALFGRLVQGLDQRVDPASLLVVVTADHGECFENGKYFDHYDCLHEAATRVPLMIRDPISEGGGRRVGAQASSIDIPATILHGLGLPPNAAFGGVALQTLDDSAAAERFVLVQTPLSKGTLPVALGRNFSSLRQVAGDPIVPLDLESVRVGVVGGGFKLIRDGEEERLLRIDGSAHDEFSDRKGDHPEMHRRMSASLDRHMESMPLQLGEAPAISEALKASLRALGYGD